jgi:hypothetical protein
VLRWFSGQLSSTVWTKIYFNYVASCWIKSVPYARWITTSSEKKLGNHLCHITATSKWTRWRLQMRSFVGNRSSSRIQSVGPQVLLGGHGVINTGSGHRVTWGLYNRVFNYLIRIHRCIYCYVAGLLKRLHFDGTTTIRQSFWQYHRALDDIYWTERIRVLFENKEDENLWLSGIGYVYEVCIASW